MTWQINSISSEQTEQLGEQLGRNLKGGEIIELVSDLGGGKTTFVRGLARGFGSRDHVASPTFTISKLYHAHNKTMHHFDFYRLPEAGLMAEELTEVMRDKDAITVVEWAGIVKDIFLEERLTITIKLEKDGSRSLTYTYPKRLTYLLGEAQ